MNRIISHQLRVRLPFTIRCTEPRAPCQQTICPPFEVQFCDRNEYASWKWMHSIASDTAIEPISIESFQHIRPGPQYVARCVCHRARNLYQKFNSSTLFLFVFCARSSHSRRRIPALARSLLLSRCLVFCLWSCSSINCMWWIAMRIYLTNGKALSPSSSSIEWSDDAQHTAHIQMQMYAAIAYCLRRYVSRLSLKPLRVCVCVCVANISCQLPHNIYLRLSALGAILTRMCACLASQKKWCFSAIYRINPNERVGQTLSV